MIYNTVNLQSGKAETFDNKTNSKATLEKAMLASASVPVLMDLVPIAGDQHTDGGVREFLPLGAAFASGVDLDHIIAISTAPIAAKKKPGEIDAIVDVLVRTLDLMNTEVGRNDFQGAELFNSILRMVDNALAAGVSKAALLKGIPTSVRNRIKDKRPIPVTFIGPTTHLDMDSLKFEPAVMRKVMKKGVDVGKKAAERLAPVFGL